MSTESPGHLAELYNLFSETLAKLPVPAAAHLKQSLDELKETVLDARPPRFALLGPWPPALRSEIERLGEVRDQDADVILCLGSPGEPWESLPAPAIALPQDGGATQALEERLLDLLPPCARLHLTRACSAKTVKHTMAVRLVKLAADMAGMIAATPLPLADLPVITALQVAMITGVAYVSGRKVERGSAVELLTALGAGAVVGAGLREAAGTLVKLVFPVGGGLVTAGVAYWGTLTLGQATVGYFIEGQTLEQVRGLFAHRRVDEAAPGEMGP